MFSREMLLACLVLLLGDLPQLISTTTTTTFVAAMSIANQDLERYFRPANATHTFASMGEERIAVDVYNFAFLNWSYVEPADNSVVVVDYKEEKARYGEGRVLSVTGKLVHITNVEDVSDDFACSQYIRGTLGAPLPAKGVPWIALVRRGRCTFEDKVKHVYQQNAAGVIIYNDKQVMQLEKMQIKGKNRAIAAVITYQNIGLVLADAVDKGHNVNMSIIEGRAGVRPVSSLNRTSVLFVSISFIVLMIISLVWLIFYYIQRFRYMQAKDQQSRNLCSVTKKAIMKIPTKTGKMTDEKDVDSDCCAICIEAYKPSDIIRILPCKHEFHKTCIDPWLIEHRTCPMCKLDVLKFYGYVVGDQIYQTPSPQHTAPVSVSVPMPLSVAAAAAPAPHYPGSEDVPVIVVALPPHQTQQPQPSSLSASNYHQRSPSSSNPHQQPQLARGRRNSAPATMPQAICTASRQFLGSEESILEYEPEAPAPTVAPLAPGAALIGSATTAMAPAFASLSTAPANPPRPSALVDLIRSRDFVIDFPRVFVLETGSVVGARETLFPARLPERSQSSLSLRHPRDWMSLVTNKLEEQQGLRRMRRDDMQQQLLSIRDSARQRRSRSADGRYSNGCFGRQRQKEAPHQASGQTQQEVNIPGLAARRSSSSNALQQLTDASYAQSRQRQRESFDFARARRRFMRRESDDISLRPLARRAAEPPHPQQRERGAAGASLRQDSNESTSSRDAYITIQVNGEGVELND